MTSPLWRLSGILGIAATMVLALGSMTMAASNSNSTQEGYVSITNVKGNTATATWYWSGLTDGEYVAVEAIYNGTTTPLPASDGTVTTAGTYSTTVTLPPGDTSWSNTTIEMAEANFAEGQLPEVPWAAGLPLILVLPWAVSAWRRRIPG
ncbi:hypothetical protein [Sulfobacillus sp. hq2]|uniref:hypothetical protein n=1 Tax=Sulfobacillus TaxID=28033 RepID=UPI000CD1573F|nr:hypothetical protein [Sulfobacillus sp. hq2]POB10236.1 hypothetical protein CO251_09750 [Sulfobacillus sp. hq2]